MFLCAAVQETYVRIGPFDDLAVKLQQEAQNSVGRRVLRPKIDGKIASGNLGRRASHRIRQRSRFIRVPRLGQCFAPREYVRRSTKMAIFKLPL